MVVAALCGGSVCRISVYEQQCGLSRCRYLMMLTARGSAVPTEIEARNLLAKSPQEACVRGS